MDSIEIDLMTSHHESCKPAANERIQQLKLCFQKMINAPKNRIVLFAGDLNSRDNEVRNSVYITEQRFDFENYLDGDIED